MNEMGMMSMPAWFEMTLGNAGNTIDVTGTPWRIVRRHGMTLSSEHSVYLTGDACGTPYVPAICVSIACAIGTGYRSGRGAGIRMDNASLSTAHKAKSDEFYTKYEDVAAEMEAYYEYDHDVFRGRTVLCPCDDPSSSSFMRYFTDNFKRFGLRRLISTCYAVDAGTDGGQVASHDDGMLARGKICVLTDDGIRCDGHLEGDGDFRSAEVTALRDMADFVITNPPFSLFRDFLAWVVDGQKRFSIIGNVNAITYKASFQLLRENRMWLGYSIHSGDREFNVPDSYPLEAAGCGMDADGRKFIKVKGVRWFTNMDHGLRHAPMRLDTMEGNLQHNGRLRRRLEKAYGNATQYPHYGNYDAIEVPLTECIPSDYDGVMGVPITFMDKYDPEQFEILMMANGNARTNTAPGVLSLVGYRPDDHDKGGLGIVNGKLCYARIMIRASQSLRHDASMEA